MCGCWRFLVVRLCCKPGFRGGPGGNRRVGGGAGPARSTLGGYIASQEAMDQYQSTGSEANHRRKMDATDSACFGP